MDPNAFQDIGSIDLTDPSYSPSIDVPALDTTPLNASTVADVSGNSAVTPVANANQSGGFDINSTLNTLAGMFNNGAQVYNSVAKTLGVPLLNGTPTVTQPAPTVVAGLTQTQWLMVGGGVAFIGVLFLLKRK